MNDVTPYPAINIVLNGWAAGLKRLLDKKIVGLYLSGSLAYGDFVSERSDIDLQAVIRSPLTKDELRSIERLHIEIERRCPEWAGRIECSYVPIELLRELTPPAKSRSWWGFGTLYAEAPAGNEWIINHYLLSVHGIALEGPRFTELIPPIAIDDVRKASARDLFQEWVPKMDDSAWLSNSHYQSYLVLNLCRILHTVIDGKAASKKISAQWTIATYPEWRDLIEEAERWVYGNEMKRQADAIAFLRFAVDRLHETKSLK
jgi:hypothetical protein